MRPVHKLGEPLEKVIAPCFGFFSLLEGRTALDISHYKHIGFVCLRKAQCLFDLTFLCAVNASNRNTPTDPPPFRYVFPRKQGHARPTSVIVWVEDYQLMFISAIEFDGLLGRRKSPSVKKLANQSLKCAILPLIC